MAWSTYILRAHGCGGELLIQMVAEGGRKEKKGEKKTKPTSDVKCYPIKLKINSPER